MSIHFREALGEYVYDKHHLSSALALNLMLTVGTVILFVHGVVVNVKGGKEFIALIKRQTGPTHFVLLQLIFAHLIKGEDQYSSKAWINDPLNTILTNIQVYA